MLNDQMETRPPPQAPPEVVQRRNSLFSLAAHRIGLQTHPDGVKSLVRDKIAGYLYGIGCPVLFEKPLALIGVPDQTLRSAIDTAAQEGRWVTHAGWGLSPSTPAALDVATECAAVACSEFLRRGRCVGWRTTEQVVAAAPRRVVSTDEDLDTNDEFFDLTFVYQLLVIEGVQLSGSTEHEERTILRVLNERMMRRVSTLVITSPVAAAGDSPLIQFLLNNYLPVEF